MEDLVHHLALSDDQSLFGAEVLEDCASLHSRVNLRSIVRRYHRASPFDSLYSSCVQVKQKPFESTHRKGVPNKRQPVALEPATPPRERKVIKTKEFESLIQIRDTTNPVIETIVPSNQSKTSRVNLLGAQPGDPWQKYTKILTWFDLVPTKALQFLDK
ncbi:uncharacterized protein B0I36DRAFT_355307 [Microdochium trichocladiopsis]|uniref:Uncharacterized protein n=1 Tax=Microdochium trichocladiopsis TaxID=1682393 RepID=A0A9P8XTM0_9PEZI|nr:uncharacterized protein B0I36DRAFT_355307 [Microdochium trichocladiopsis]KAH7016530.1 hypothetical protein B0I36DRAFT_355307 [Microdochium trichocladiopsis]